MLCMLMEDYLSELGCEVVATASRLDEAVKVARDVIADVAVLDINLAGEQSYPAARVLKARNIPFMFATGYAPAELPFGLEGARVLNKPFSLEQLQKALRAMDVHRAKTVA